MRKINYFDKEYTLHEFIELNVLANRGTQNNIDKAVMIEYCKNDNIKITGKESKKELFELMCENGYSDEKWEEIAGIGVVSGAYQKQFNITHADVKRLEKFNVLKVVGTLRTRAYGKYIYSPLYSVSQFFTYEQNDIDRLLLLYPKGKRLPVRKQ